MCTYELADRAKSFPSAQLDEVFDVTSVAPHKTASSGMRSEVHAPSSIDESGWASRVDHGNGRKRAGEPGGSLLAMDLFDPIAKYAIDTG